MQPDAPSLRYYQAMHGAWRGTLAFALTNAAAFRAAPMSWDDRLRVLAMALQSRLGLPLRMETTVDAHARAAQGEVLHTTRVSALGMTGYRGAEVLTLHADGHRATLRGEQHLWPALWRPQPWADTPIEVDADAAGALYRFTWLGAEMLQRTRVVPEGLQLTQETAWSKASVLLRRKGATGNP